MRSSATLRVGTVITRLEGGAGQLALRGALSLDPACYPGETGLLVPPGRPHLIADAVRFLLDSPEASARMATAARARLGKRFGEQALRQALTAAYSTGGAMA